MGELTRAEYQLLFERMLGHARRGRAVEAAGGAAPTDEEVADHMRAHDPLAARLSRREAIREASRARKANEVAVQTRLTPTATPRRIDVPFNRGIYANQSEYQYRVIVTTTTAGRPDPGGLLVTFGSDSLLTGEQIQARALRLHAQLPATTYNVYPTSLDPTRSSQTFAALPISITRYEPQ